MTVRGQSDLTASYTVAGHGANVDVNVIGGHIGRVGSKLEPAFANFYEDQMIDISTQQTDRDKTYSITQLCREFEVTPRTLRFYEQKGLLAPARRGWTRIFNYRDRARLQLILRGKRVGFSLEEIKEMLDLYKLRDGQMTQLTVASTKLRERLVALRHQRLEIDEAIADLERTCDIVDGMLKEKSGDMAASA